MQHVALKPINWFLYEGDTSALRTAIGTYGLIELSCLLTVLVLAMAS